MKDLIRRITQISSPSSREEDIRKFIKNELKSIKGITITTDVSGNLIVRKKGTGKRIMFAAHMDEIGFMITHIEEKGYLRFTNIGGFFPFNSHNVAVIIDGKYEGVILKNSDKFKENVGLNDMYIDAGFEDKKEAGKYVSIGSYGTYKQVFMDRGNRIITKSLDDRIGCVILIEAIKNMPSTNNDLYFVFTVQEEIGVKGARTSTYEIEPDIGIAVDVTGTGDMPKSGKMEVYLGKGPAIKIMDGGMIADRDVVDLMERTAKKIKIPYQREILKGGSTDAMVIQVSKGGVKSGCLSIPTRNLHSPYEIVDVRDVENSIKLLIGVAKNG